MQRLITRLKETIYPEIEKFITNAQIVLAEQFGMDYKNFSLEEAEAKFVGEKGNMDPEVLDWISDMFQDIRYLLEMKQLESPQVGQEKILDIVPVTGLIVNRFYRTENELRTVVEHWGDSFPAEESSGEEKEKEDGGRSVTSIGEERNGEPLPGEKSGSPKDGDGVQNGLFDPFEKNPTWVESKGGRSFSESLRSTRMLVRSENSTDAKMSPVRNKLRSSSSVENIT